MKMDITISVPGLPFNGNTFDNQSLGGSETAGYYMGRALAKLGHHVLVFCNTPERVACADVDYIPHGLFRQYAEHVIHDVCIVQRQPDLFMTPCSARFSALWCHDLASGRIESAIKGCAWNYDKLFVLSDFMHKQYKEVCNIPEDLLFQTRNGLDLELVEEVRANIASKADLKRNPLSLVYTSRPERGLDVLLMHIMPRILKHEPNAKLFIAGYDNNVGHLQEYYGQCRMLAQQLGPNVVTELGPLTKRQLYEVYHAAGLYVYPLPSVLIPLFDEVSCITAMETQACGLPMITTKRGAMPETLGEGAAVLLEQPIHTESYYDAFADAALRLMRNPHEWRKASAAGIAKAKELSWDTVAEEWSIMFEQEIRKNNNSPQTLANHFYRRSDIYAAQYVLDKLPADDMPTKFIRERIAKDFAFANSPEGMREQYEKIGSTHDAAVINWSPNEPRYLAMRDWLSRHPELKTAIDYGCAHGGYATNLLKDLPHMSITGVDIDMHGIELAHQFAEQLGVSKRFRGVVGDYKRLSDDTIPEMREQYDVAIAQEVLEHVIDPREVLIALEQRVKDGGIVYITVPYGPWELTDYSRYPYRAHVREFDAHDIRDLLQVKGAEANVTTTSMSFGISPITHEPLGWWVIQYIVTAENRGKIGAIDMERKLWLQRPRQTVSATIIAGPKAEETLHWCLRSLENVADEVIIMDCGLANEAKRIIQSYEWRDFDESRSIAEQRDQRSFLNIRVLPGVNPTREGFETPRNMAIQHATQDWILWIDTDEKIIQSEKMTKYLRKNMFQGYSIRQHHFSVDTHFDADMPVRLFRNNGKLRFYGMIHEHPESELNKGPGTTIVLADVHIPHVGYLIESGRQVKFHRNWPMLQADIAKYPTRMLQKHFIMRDEMLLVNQEIHQNGGRMSASIRDRCQKVIDTYREFFLGKGHFSNIDPIGYYSQACAVLGLGFDTSISLSANRDDAQPGALLKVRFANMQDYLAEVTRRAQDVARPYENQYW